MDTTEIALTALKILSPVLAAGLTWLAARLASLIRGRVANEALQGILLRVGDAVLTAVKELDQTVVAEIKATSVDGRIEPGERQRIKDTAVAKVKGYLGAEGVEQMSRVLGIGNASLDGFIGSKVEAAVHDLRRTDPTRFNGASGGALPFPPAPAE